MFRARKGSDASPDRRPERAAKDIRSRSGSLRSALSKRCQARRLARRSDPHVSASQGQRRTARQAPRAGREGHPIKVWLVAECAEQALPGPPAGEPFVTVGPTELISGLYLGGGRLFVFP